MTTKSSTIFKMRDHVWEQYKDSLPLLTGSDEPCSQCYARDKRKCSCAQLDFFTDYKDPSEEDIDAFKRRTKDSLARLRTVTFDPQIDEEANKKQEFYDQHTAFVIEIDTAWSKFKGALETHKYTQQEDAIKALLIGMERMCAMRQGRRSISPPDTHQTPPPSSSSPTTI